jgi:hypothetical protein
MSSSQWAEVLSADAFSAFEDAGLDNEKARFQQTLSYDFATSNSVCFPDCQINNVSLI